MKDVVLTDRGPKPIGPYSQAIKAGGLLFASGQVALIPSRTNSSQAISPSRLNASLKM